MEQTKGVSIEAQLDRLRNYAKFKEWIVSEEFIDAGWSGKDDNRPDFKRLMSAASGERCWKRCWGGWGDIMGMRLK